VITAVVLGSSMNIYLFY